jgi:hypothetical protein
MVSVKNVIADHDSMVADNEGLMEVMQDEESREKKP